MKSVHFIYLKVIAALVLSSVLVHGENQCQELTIRHWKHMDYLNNCTVVLGNLILMFPSPFEFWTGYSIEEINTREFPLREITGYFLVYGLRDLDSLGGMFPQLTVIRARTLLLNYGFMITQSDIKEISLRNLQSIGRGSVRVDGENPRLCLPTKYDWQAVIKNGKFIVNARATSSNCSWLQSNRCFSCPGISHDKCWHNGACQRFPIFFKRPGNRKFECHKLCVGGCTNGNSSGCMTCLDIKDGDECVERCPENKLLHDTFRRCIEKSECIAKGWRVYKYRCVDHCPVDYSSLIANNDTAKPATETNVCVKCIAKCPRWCNTTSAITHISQLEQLGRGCTVINGSLEIKMQDSQDHIMDELREFLGEVERIRGVLKIHRSPAITDLSFLKNLRMIKGGGPTELAVHIFENRNLQALIDWKFLGSHLIEVLSGTFLIYGNGMLCPGEVKKFIKKLNRMPLKNDKDIIHNNGRRNICLEASIDTSYYVHSHDTVAIRWKDVNTHNQRIYSGFNIRYIEVNPLHTHEEVNQFYERDSCSFKGWHHKYVYRGDWNVTEDGFLEILLKNLEQSTYYDFAVETYHYSVDDPSVQAMLHNDPDADGASSGSKRFKTAMDVPNRVENFAPIKVTSTSITLQWGVLQKEADDVDFIYVDVVPLPFNETQIDMRNYCHDPIEPFEDAPTIDDINEPKNGLANLTCCQQCCLLKERESGPELDRNDLFGINLAKFADSVPRENTEVSSRAYKYREKINKDRRDFVIDILEPYTDYRFYIHACAGENKCSPYQTLTQITLLNDTLDRVELKIGSYYVMNQTFFVSFDQPDANGPVIVYIVEIYKYNGTKSIVQSYCITRKDHQANKFTFANKLKPGKYAFRVAVTSIARQGPFTELHSFEVFPGTTPDTSNNAWMTVVILILVFIACAVGVGYYYRHRIRIIRRDRREDRHGLLEAFNVDLDEIELHDRDEDRLFVIAEE